MSTVWFYCQGFWVFLSILNLSRYWHVITSDIRNLCSKIKPGNDPDFWIYVAAISSNLGAGWAHEWILLFPTDPTWLIEGICYKTSLDDWFISIMGNLELLDFYTFLPQGKKVWKHKNTFSDQYMQPGEKNNCFIFSWNNFILSWKGFSSNPSKIRFRYFWLNLTRLNLDCVKVLFYCVNLFFFQLQLSNTEA